MIRKLFDGAAGRGLYCGTDVGKYFNESFCFGGPPI